MASRMMKPIRWLLADTDARSVPTIDPFTAWLRDEDGGAQTNAGVVVTQDNAMAIGAVFASATLIMDTVAMLPARNYVHRGEYRLPAATRPVWMDDPDPDGLIWHAFIKQWVLSKLLYHGACVRKLRDEDGDVIALKVLDPRKVEPQRDHRGRVVYVYDGGRSIIQAEDMIYDSELIYPGQVKGVSRVSELRGMFGLAKALEEFSARFFGQGSTSTGVLEIPGEGDDEKAERIKNRWEENHKGLRKAHRIGVLFGGGKFVKTSVDPEQAQMLESKHFSVEEVARSFRIHPSMIGVIQPGTQAYDSREQDAIQYTTFTITASYLTPMEQHLNRLLPRQEFVKFTTGALLRAALADRYAAYNAGMQGGFLTINRINQLEDEPPVEGGDEYRVPLSAVSLSAASLAETKERVDMFKTLTDSGVTAESAASIAGLPSVTTTATPEAATTAGERDLTIAETIQKIYLGVDKVVTADEARQIINSEAGANLPIPGPGFTPATPSEGTAA